jgi:hypothetical protein
MLQFNPFLRPSAAECMQNDFFKHVKKTILKLTFDDTNFLPEIALSDDSTMKEIKSAFV